MKSPSFSSRFLRDKIQTHISKAYFKISFGNKIDFMSMKQAAEGPVVQSLVSDNPGLKFNTLLSF